MAASTGAPGHGPHELRGPGARAGGHGDGGEDSPLRHLERVVQHEAAALALDMADPASSVALRRLVEEEIDRWNLEHRRGQRAFALSDREVVADRAMRNLIGYGPLHELLADDDVWELMVNAPDAIFVRRHRGPSGYHHEAFHDDEHVLRTMTKLLDDAGSHRKLDPAEGLQDAQLASGARVHIVHGDVARGGHLLVNIRKFTGLAFSRLEQLVHTGMLDAAVARFLTAAVSARCSIVFAGAPGSGKTTLLSCCTAALDPTLRVVTAEEVFELDIPVANVAQLQTRSARNDRTEVDLRRLVSGFLRMSPDVAIVGEVRDREALPRLLRSRLNGCDLLLCAVRPSAEPSLRRPSRPVDCEQPCRRPAGCASGSLDLAAAQSEPQARGAGLRCRKASPIGQRVDCAARNGPAGASRGWGSVVVEVPRLAASALISRRAS